MADDNTERSKKEILSASKVAWGRWLQIYTNGYGKWDESVEGDMENTTGAGQQLSNQGTCQL